MAVDAAGDVAALSIYHLSEDDAARWDGDRVTLCVLDPVGTLKLVAVTLPAGSEGSTSAGSVTTGSGALAVSATPLPAAEGGGCAYAYPGVAVTRPECLLVNGRPALGAAGGGGGGGSPHLSVKAFDR